MGTLLSVRHHAVEQKSGVSIRCLVLMFGTAQVVSRSPCHRFLISVVTFTKSLQRTDKFPASCAGKYHGNAWFLALSAGTKRENLGEKRMNSL